MTIRGQILVSSTDDDPLALRVWIQNVSVCTFKTSPCVLAPHVHVSTHVRVVLAYTGTLYTVTFLNPHGVFFHVFFQRAAKHTNNNNTHKHTPNTHHDHQTTPRPQRHTPHNTTHNITRRQRERERDKTRQEKTVQDKKTREDVGGETRQDKRRSKEEKRQDEKEERMSKASEESR